MQQRAIRRSALRPLQAEARKPQKTATDLSIKVALGVHADKRLVRLYDRMEYAHTTYCKFGVDLRNVEIT